METLSSAGADVNQVMTFEQRVQTFILGLSDETKLMTRALFSLLLLIIEIKLGLKLYSFCFKYYNTLMDKLSPTAVATATDKGCNNSNSSLTSPSGQKKKAHQVGGEVSKRTRGRKILNRKAFGKQRSAPSAAAAVAAKEEGEVEEVSERSIPTKKRSNKQTADTTSSLPSPPSSSSSNSLVSDTGTELRTVLKKVSPAKLVGKTRSVSKDSPKDSKKKKHETTMNDSGIMSYVKYVFYRIKRLLTPSRYIGRSRKINTAQSPVRLSGRFFAIVKKVWGFIIWPIAWVFGKG